MKIQLKQIGLLNDITIDLSNNLIVLCGPNNTGKTFAAYSIYGAYHLSRQIGFRLSSTPDDAILNLLKSGNNSFNILEFFKRIEKKIFDTFARLYKRELPNIFASSPELFASSEIKFFFAKGEIEEEIKKMEFLHSFTLTRLVKITLEKEMNSEDLRVVLVEEQTNNPRNLIFSDEELASIIQGEVIQNILKTIFASAYITPAERIAINIFSKELSVKRNEIVDQLLVYKEKQNQQIKLLRNAQRYPLPIRISLEIAEDLATLQKNKSEFEELATFLENELLKGKIKVSKEGDVQFSPFKSKVKNLNLHLTASIVKSLSNLVFYFRHLAKKNDFIIIDEPELNLHPDNQRNITRFIARVVNCGFKVMISTHSDYIIRELNNLIMLKEAGKRAYPFMEKYNYFKEELIDRKNVGAYLFKPKEAHDLIIDETGFEIETIDRAIGELNQSSEDITLNLF